MQQAHLHVIETVSQETRSSASRQLQFLQDDRQQHGEKQEIVDGEKIIVDVNCERLIPDDEQNIPGGEHEQPQSPLSTTKAKRVHWVRFQVISAICLVLKPRCRHHSVQLLTYNCTGYRGSMMRGIGRLMWMSRRLFHQLHTRKLRQR